MCAFYTPIFERGWLKKQKEDTRKRNEGEEPKYIPVDDENAEKSMDGVDVNSD